MKRLLFALTIILALNVALAANVDLDQLDIAKFSLTTDEEKTINFEETEYIITTDSITPSEIKLFFSPNNLVITAKKEKPIEIDLNNDREVDFSLTYLTNLDAVTTIELKKTDLPEDEMDDESSPISDLNPKDQVNDILASIKANLKFLVYAVIVLIVLIIIVKSYKKRANPERLYSKAEALHKEAQEFHKDGDEETAQELYDKAEELREKARDMENSEV
ncbi:MAG: hypothetical protein CMH63_01585 [Nanoarchaeota archaeon]|jgi:hypothetical protein|nr:hypothetical protein [Nanoarchaeota archaeon]|tara:strand:+ start:2783 stop:3442 length:660 start_codon:yes stop_codon:yes gene_type:complete